MERQLPGHVISSVEDGSIAQELELAAGDRLLSINGQSLEDILDYHYLIKDEYLEIEIEKPDGEVWELEIEKDFDEDLGIEFENPLMDNYRSCKNKCIFCFIDQLPKGMRPTLYFKDDDSRLSFLQGNYVTLTNMSDHDIDRIISYRLEPINISFHTMNPALRRKMLSNRFAGDIFGKVRRLADAGIEMNGQIVLCKGVNDNDELDFSLRMLEEYLPALKSVSVVPVGLTKYRDHLYPLEPFTAEDAAQVLAQINKWQAYYKEKWDTHLVHAGDEWYLMAGQELPGAESYDGYLQLENGVGMLRLLIDEATEALCRLKADGRSFSCSIATGKLAYPFLRDIAAGVCEKYPGVRIHVYAIENDFFGPMITVSGLLTGTDLIRQLQGKALGETLLLPCNMLRSGEMVFLDDVTVSEVETALQTRVTIVESSGQNLIKACIGEEKTDE